MSEHPRTSIDEKLHAAARTPAPRPEFVAALKERLAAEAGAQAGKSPAAPNPASPAASRGDWSGVAVPREKLRDAPEGGTGRRALLRQPVRPAPLRGAWVAAIGVVAILFAAFLAIGPQRVIAALGGLFGYIPGVGVVQNGAGLMVLDSPVTLERGGITLTIQQAAADPAHTVVVYQADGLSIDAANSQGEGASTGGPAALLLPDGSILAQTAGGGPGWGTGYQMRLAFPALPQGVDHATLVIQRLMDMPAGAAPEDWQLPFRFKPAPADLKVMPVYELSTPQAVETQNIASPRAGQVPGEATETQNLASLPPTPAPVETSGAGDIASPSPAGVQLVLERAIDLGDGYQLEGAFTWQGQAYSSVAIDFMDLSPFTLTGASGQKIPYEETNADNPDAGPTRSPWAIRTGSKAFPGPWTLRVDHLTAFQQVTAGSASLSIDFGADPQIGQTWTLDQTVEAAGKKLHAVSARLWSEPRNGNPVLTVDFETTPDVTGLGIEDQANQPDPSHPSAGAGGGGGGGGAEPTPKPGAISAAIAYFKLPAGVHQLDLTAVDYTIDGPWTVTWNPPAADQQITPTAAAQACLTNATWQQIKSQASTTLPAGLAGRLLVEGYDGGLMPGLSLVNVDGSGKQALAEGGWSSLSPDGKWVAMNESNGPGITLLDVASGVKTSVPNTTGEDYHPVWSPDGQMLAFVRGTSGVYTIRRDGSGLKRAVDGSRIRSLAGWLPDGAGLVITSLGPGGSTVQTVDLSSGAIHDQFTLNNAKGGFVQLSPDGKRVVFSEMVVGLPSYGIYVSNLDGSGKRLLAGLESGAASSGAWSPDGKWLALEVSEPDSLTGPAGTLLVQVDTCQAWLVPGVQGSVTGWAASRP